MYSPGLFIVQLFIVIVFVILFRLLNDNRISIGSGSILLGISIAAFLLLPYVVLKWGFIPAVIILILAVIFGMELVIMLEEKKFKIFNLNNEKGFFNLAAKVKRFNLAHRFKFLEDILSFKKMQEIAEVRKSSLVVNTEANDIKPDGTDILKNFSANDNISYVDFENKNEQYGDIFSKFIRGEILASEVRERIQNKSLESPEEAANQDAKEKGTRNVIKKASSKSNKKQPSGTAADTETTDKSQTEITVEQYIDFAFKAKKEGRFMEAVEYYIKALEKKPEEQLILWIIIDVCSLYKELGQESLAKEMIESYFETIGDSISPEVRNDISKNFGI